MIALDAQCCCAGSDELHLNLPHSLQTMETVLKDVIVLYPLRADVHRRLFTRLVVKRIDADVMFA